MNVFLYYKTLTIRLDNIVAIIFQKTISSPCQGRSKCLQLSHNKQITAAKEAAIKSSIKKEWNKNWNIIKTNMYNIFLHINIYQP